MTVVCPADVVPATARAERGWRAFQAAGPLDFALTGILAGITAALAGAGVAVFAVSTFDTDLILVREASLGAAVAALVEDGYEVREP